MLDPSGDAGAAQGAKPSSPITRVVRGLEDLLLVLLLSGLILFAAVQIVLRNFFDTGIIWGDELLRILVLWLALLGALAASRDNRQINIDVLSRFLPPFWKRLSGAVIALFTALVCAVAAWACTGLVRDAYEFEDTLVSTLPAWPFMLVLPVGFALMACRYLIHFARQLLGRQP